MEDYDALSLIASSARQSKHRSFAAVAQAASSITSIASISEEEHRVLDRLPIPTKKELLRVRLAQGRLGALGRQDFRVVPSSIEQRTGEQSLDLYEAVERAGKKSTFVCRKSQNPGMSIHSPRASRVRRLSLSLRLNQSRANRSKTRLTSLTRSKQKISTKKVMGPLLVDVKARLTSQQFQGIRLKTLRRYMSIWNVAAKKMTQTFCEGASMVLLRTIRIFLARLESQKRYNLQTCQTRREGDFVVQVMYAREIAVVATQVIVRRKFARIKKAQGSCVDAAARTLQCLARILNAKSAFRLLTYKKKKQSSAALEIQRFLRGITSRKRARTLRASAAAAKRMTLKNQLRTKRCLFFQSHGAATVIQTHWQKRRDERLNYFAQERLRARKADVIIRSMSTFLARAKLRRSRALGKSVTCLKNSSAIFIQSQYRRRLAVKNVYQLHNDACVAITARRKKHASQLHSLVIHDTKSKCARWRVSLRRAHRLALSIPGATGRSLKISKPPRPETAATKIAAMYRAYHRAGSVQEGLILAKAQTYVNDAQKRKRMAILMQRFARTLIARRSAIERRQRMNAISITKCIRGYQGRAAVFHYRAMQGATVRVQAFARKRSVIVAYGPHRLWRQRLNTPSIMVQAQYRRQKLLKRGVAEFKMASFRDEVTLQVHAKLLACRQITCTELCVESYRSSSDYRGEFQTIFAHHCHAYPVPRSDARPGLVTQQHCYGAKMTSSEFVRLLKCVSKGTRRKYGGLQLIKVSDLELIFAKEKQHGEKYIQFRTFLVCLDHVCSRVWPSLKFEAKGVPHLRAARALTMLNYEWLPSTWAANIREALYIRAERKVIAASIRIQSICRATAVRQNLRAHWQDQNKTIRACIRHTASVNIQKRLARGPAAREAVSKLAVQAFKKYSVDQDEFLHYMLKSPAGADFSGDSGKLRHVRHAFYWAFVGLGKREGDVPRLHSKESRVTWAKPKLLRSYDISKISQRPTKRTAFVVDCAFCGINAAERLCLGACADTYCRVCWEGVHQRGKRQYHSFRTIIPCVDCGGTQPASRICSDCSASAMRTVSLCDVCFQNRHPLDGLAWQRPLLKLPTTSNKIMSRNRSKTANSGEHRWTALVQPCGVCGNFAARWRCGSCQQCYCATCYSRAHSKGACIAHSCDHLGYYTTKVHARDEHNFLTNARRLREQARLESARSADPSVRNHAALIIQRCHRAVLGWLAGQAQLTCDSKQTQGEADDKTEYQVLRRIEFWKRARARYFIMQNVADACWDVNLSANPKKRPKIGFQVGHVTDLGDQGDQGGVRLPGCAYPVVGEKKVYVSHDLREIIRPNDRIRIGSRICRVNATHPDAITESNIKLRFCWLGRSRRGDGIFMYRIPPQATTSKIWTTFGRVAYESQLTQSSINQYRGYHSISARYQLIVATRLQRLLPKLAAKVQTWSKRHDEIQVKIRVWTLEWQYILDARERKAERKAT